MRVFLLSALLAIGCGRTPDPAAEASDPAAAAPDPTVEAADPASIASPVSIRFVRPLDSDTVSSPVAIVMEAQGFLLAPAGEMAEGSGHLHVMVDTAFVAPGSVIPKNDHHLHFGDGSAEAQIDLAPGEHVLRLQAGNGAHIALDGPSYRDEIRIVVRN